MGNDRRADGSKNNPGSLNRFEPGHELGPIGDRNEYEQSIDVLPKDERELAQESTRLADLYQYFSAQKIDMPPQLVERVARLYSFAVQERIRVLKEINQELMKYLNDVGQDWGISQ